jgi:cardiolipin synthase
MPATQKRRTGYTSGNSIKLIRSGSSYFNTLSDLIEQANHSIHLQVYIFHEDETGKHIAQKLIEAAHRGVHVYLMPDGYASQGLSKKFIKSLTDAGVHFRYFQPLLKSEHFYFGRRLHHKVTVVDGYHSLVTGINISNHYNDTPDGPAWMDWAVYNQGEASYELYKVCLQLWSKAELPIRKLPKELLKETIDADCMVRVRRNDWVKRYNQISRSYIDMLRTSSSQVMIMSSYFIPGWFIRQRLSKAAKRGVKIKLILAGVSDVRLAKSAECYIYRWFYRKNIEVYEYNTCVLHSKLAVQDGKWVTVGSYNVNNISAYASVELNFDIANLDFARSTQERLEEIIEHECTLITPEIYRIRYNFIKRSLQFLSYITVRLLINISTFYFKQI